MVVVEEIIETVAVDPVFVVAKVLGIGAGIDLVKIR
jgi:hypothetical protein